MSELHWFVDGFTCFRGHLSISGWAFHSVQSIREMGMVLPGQDYVKLSGYGLKSVDVESSHGPAAHNCRFNVDVKVADASEVANLKLVFSLTDGRQLEIDQLSLPKVLVDPYHLLWRKFFAMLRERPTGTLLQIGAPNPTVAPPGMGFVGMDLKPGKDVEVVGDPHLLSSLFEPGRFDAIVTMSVFEHLIMPWKVVLEMNRVMKVGGLVLVASHHSYPLHEEPADYWRFSDRAWQGLFNQDTGFKILTAALGEPASIVPQTLYSITRDLEHQRAFLGSIVLCEKIAETSLRWDVDAKSIVGP